MRARPRCRVLLGIAALVALALAHTRRDPCARRGRRWGGGCRRARRRSRAASSSARTRGSTRRPKEDFPRAGLSHLLAVSGQNVDPARAAGDAAAGARSGSRCATRLVWVLALIAVYVPLAGAGPSIQRAGVMGALGLVATLAGRRASPLYALALAAIVTVAIDPGVAADVGWQLSFAAVLGIYLLAGRIRDALLGGRGRARAGWRRALAEGAASPSPRPWRRRR